ncbi:MAG: 50S ribosomal protein L11 methyltransferase [Deltaproteobacteria bacterium]|nr:50S ribosomal protein L11 methyltransferase [Deltaproteobacteria bacterium]
MAEGRGRSAAIAEGRRWGELVVVGGAPEAEELLVGLLYEQGALGLWQEGATLRAYFPSDADLVACATGLRGRLRALAGPLPGRTLPEIHLGEVKEEAWADVCRLHFRATRISPRLVIAPSWDPVSPVSGQVVITLDPGLAFGTGAHPTTRFCLQVLDRLAPEGKAVLDVGTGSGILAIAAARLGARQVVALDNDPQAISVAAENLAANGVAPRVALHTGGLESVGGPYDLILANLSAPDLLKLRPDFLRRLVPGGTLVLAGLTLADATEVRVAYQSAGLGLLAESSEDGWVGLAFEPAAWPAT